MDLHGVHAATVFPTPVGVFPPWPCHVIHGASLPHACGGVSTSSHRYAVNDWSSPRLWGCFPPPCLPIDKASVFPTPVGVFPTPAQTPTAGPSLPHACGGVSKETMNRIHAVMSSPRLWGCFRRRWMRNQRHHVFPTPVGVFPMIPPGVKMPRSLPHACGGVSEPVPW